MKKLIYNILGLTEYNKILLKSIRHQLWFLKKNLNFNFTYYTSIINNNDEDYLLCKRLIESYKLSINNDLSDNTSDIWKKMINNHYADLINCLENKKISELSALLSNLF